MRRFPRLALIGGALLGIYLIISRFPLFPPRVVTMPDAVPFVPLLALAYWAVLVIGWFLPLAIRDDARFAACVRSCILAFIITASMWILLPTTLIRPAFTQVWWNLPYQLLSRVDVPTNICPCGHILAPVIGAWFLGGERPRWWPWLAASVIVSAATIVLTWQHRPVDVLLGAMIAVVAIIGASRLGRRTHPTTQTLAPR